METLNMVLNIGIIITDIVIIAMVWRRWKK